MLSDSLDDKLVEGSMEEFEDRRWFIKYDFKSVLDPKFTFIKVPEFDMPHRYYVNQLHEMTTIHKEEYD